jgi:hypothetical protein
MRDGIDRNRLRQAFFEDYVPPAPGLAERTLSRVRAGHHDERQAPHWSLGLVAAALAVVMVATLVLWRTGALPRDHQAGQAPPRGPAPSAAPSPDATFVYELAGPKTQTRVDWNGRGRGSVQLPYDDAVGSGISPDGAYMWTNNPSGNGAAILDARGRLVTTASFFAEWADDSRHACEIERAKTAGPAISELAVYEVTSGGIKTTAVPVPPLDQTGGVLACSVTADRAVVDGVVDNGTSESLLLVQVTTGRILSGLRHVPLNSMEGVTASPDARYAATYDPTTRSSTIWDMGSTNAVGHVPGTVTQFSGDGARVVLNSDLAGGSCSVMDWRTGRVFWTGPGHASGTRAEPGGRALVIEPVVDAPSGARTIPSPAPMVRPRLSGSLVLVRDDGSAVVLASGGVHLL